MSPITDAHCAKCECAQTPCECAARLRELETALTAAQAAIKRRDEVIEELFVIFKCAGYWRNWVAAKLKEVPNDRA